MLYPLPTAKEDVLKVATPLLFKMPVPSVLEPSLKVTVPPAIPAPGPVGETVAVKVTDCPKAEGLAEDANVVVVAVAAAAEDAVEAGESRKVEPLPMVVTVM